MVVLELAAIVVACLLALELRASWIERREDEETGVYDWEQEQ